MSSIRERMERAREMASNGSHDDAVRFLRESLASIDPGDDFMAAADAHLLIMDIEKARLRSQPVVVNGTGPDPAQVTRNGLPAPPHVITANEPRTPPAITGPTVPRPTDPAGDEALRRDAMQAWKEASRLLDEGESFHAQQRLLSARRLFSKLGDASMLATVDVAITRAKGTGVPARVSSNSAAQVAMETGSVVVPDRDITTTFTAAMAANERGDYKAALDGLQHVLGSAVGPERDAIEKHVRRLQQLVSLREKMGHLDTSKGFSQAGEAGASDIEESQVNRPAMSGGFSKPSAPVDRETADKVQKHKEAERLIVEAENCTSVPEAIEKLQDAAHLHLITGTRRDRVEWIYEKINTIKQHGLQRQSGLFENEQFSPALLRDYAFSQIDKAKHEARYGRYLVALEAYKRSVSALVKAGWDDGQVAYIIQDMIDVRKRQDDVERHAARLQSLIEAELAILLENIDAWRAGRAVDVASHDSMDENVHRPGRERTVEEKNMQKMLEDQQQRSQQKAAMFRSMDEARHLVQVGRFDEARREYTAILGIMEDLGGWDAQEQIILDEIKNLTSLEARKKEIDALATRRLTPTTKASEDLEEQVFLMKKAAVLNQEHMKEQLILRRLRDEQERTVFEILIPMANKLKQEGKLQDALVEFKEALKMLVEAGWTNQIQALRDEITGLEAAVVSLKGPGKTITERHSIRDEVFDSIMPAARDATTCGNYHEARELYELAITKLRSIGWDEYINPILENMQDLESKLQDTCDTMDEVPPGGATTNDHVDMGLRFLAKDMKKYALMEFHKALVIARTTGETGVAVELEKQVKKLELEVRLDESQQLLMEKKKHLA